MPKAGGAWGQGTSDQFLVRPEASRGATVCDQPSTPWPGHQGWGRVTRPGPRQSPRNLELRSLDMAGWPLPCPLAQPQAKIPSLSFGRPRTT